MSYQPVRFVHAANLSLDVPVRTTETLSEIEYQFLEDARDHALETVVDNCVKRKVDFLLLSGDTFQERARSLRSRMALTEAFDRLNDAEVQVFVIPDRTNPADAWRAMPLLPRNVTICDNWSHEPVAVLRDGKVVATVSNGLPVEEPDEFGIRLPTDIAPEHERQVFRISVCRYQPDAIADPDVNEDEDSVAPAALTIHQQVQRFFEDSESQYAALIGWTDRVTIKAGDLVAHCPGRTQPDSARDENGSCSLVEVSSDGVIRVGRIETAAVAFHSLEVDAGSLGRDDEVVNRMRVVLNSVERKASHRMWLVQWTIKAGSELLDALERPDATKELVAKLQGRAVKDESIATAHLLRIVPDATSLENERPTAAQFLELLDGCGVDVELLEEVLASSELEATWKERLTALIGEIELDQVENSARQLGLGWFADVREEGSPA